MKILDCTLRDGGYYTNWDFDDALVTTYINAMKRSGHAPRLYVHDLPPLYYWLSPYEVPYRNGQLLYPLSSNGGLFVASDQFPDALYLAFRGNGVLGFIHSVIPSTGHAVFSYCNQQWLYNGRLPNGLCEGFLSEVIPPGSS